MGGVERSAIVSAGRIMATLALATCALVTGTAVLLAVSAAASAGQRVTPLPGVTVSGSIAYVWHGDPARGCAAAGVCGVRGSLIVGPAGDTVFDPTQRAGSISLSPSSAVVRVRRDEPGASPGLCVDPLPLDFLDLLLQRSGGGRLRGTLQGFAQLSSGRCAGPTAGDLAHLGLSVRRLPTRRPGFDASGRRAFTAGPFSGELISTVVIRPGGSASGSTSSGASSAPPSRPRKVLRELVETDYRVAGVTGTLTTAFAGRPDPLCEQFDSCGSHGTLSSALTRASGTVTVIGSRVVRRRVSPAAARRDFYAGRLPLEAFGDATGRSTLTAMLTWAAGGSCVDARAAGVAPLDPQASGRKLVLLLGVAADQGGIDLLRSRCPGPLATDVVGAKPLAHGSIDLRQLGSRRLVVTLRNPGAFRSSGYAGSRGGSLTVVLRLVRIRAHTLLGYN